MRGTFWIPTGPARTQYFVETFQRFSAVAIRVDAHLVAKLSAEQPANRYAKRLAEYIPKRGVDSANRVVHNSRHGACARSGELQFPEQAVDVARVFAEEQRFERTQNRRQAWSEKTFAEPPNRF